MVRKRLAIALLLLLAVSCRSTEPVQYTEDEIRNALMSLSSDMFSEVDTASPVEEERIIEALPATYSAYAEYVPLYGSIASDYAEKISQIISPLLPQPMHVVLETASAIAESGLPAYIHDDTSFTEGIRQMVYSDVLDIYRKGLSSRDGGLREAFSQSYSEFMAVRAAYLNLSSVGHPVYIPEPGMIDREMAAAILADALFNRLGEAEKTLKNMPSGLSSGYYYVFWGGR